MKIPVFPYADSLIRNALEEVHMDMYVIDCAQVLLFGSQIRSEDKYPSRSSESSPSCNTLLHSQSNQHV